MPNYKFQIVNNIQSLKFRIFDYFKKGLYPAPLFKHIRKSSAAREKSQSNFYLINFFKSGAGFTLIEVIVAVFIFVLVFVGLIALVSNVFVSSGKQSNLLADSDQARKLSFSIINELRNAAVSSAGAYQLETASEQTLTFYANLDGGTDVERVRYFVQNGALMRGLIKPTGNPLAYNSGNEKITTVQNNLANGGYAVFYYYSGAYTGSQTALIQPVNVTTVKFIKMDLKVYNKGGVTNTNYYSVTASAAIRGLKTNLGD